ncbi:hypothetical protein HDU67_010282, partial [Dinochytrium kinnereticum]
MEVHLINDASTIDIPPPDLIEAAATATHHLPTEEGLNPCLWVPLRGMIRIRLPFALHRNPENRNLKPSCLTVTLVGRAWDGRVFYNTSEYVWTTVRFAQAQKVDGAALPRVGRELDRVFEVARAGKVPHLDFPFTLKIPSTLPPTATPPPHTTPSSLDDLLLRKRNDATPTLVDKLATLDENLALWCFPSYHVTATLSFQSFSVCAKQTTPVPREVGIR